MDGRDIIILYGNAGELHETAIKFTTSAAPTVTVVSGNGSIKQKVLTNGGSALALQFTTNGQTIVQVGDKTLLYILGELSCAQISKEPLTVPILQTAPTHTSSGFCTHPLAELWLNIARKTPS